MIILENFRHRHVYGCGSPHLTEGPVSRCPPPGEKSNLDKAAAPSTCGRGRGTSEGSAHLKGLSRPSGERTRAQPRTRPSP